MSVALHDALESLYADIGTEVHQSVIHVLHVVIVVDVEWQLHYNLSCVDVVVEEEGGYSCASLAVDHSPVDRCCTAILRQKGCMHIKRTVFWHIPHHLGQHAEGHYHLKVGIV